MTPVDASDVNACLPFMTNVVAAMVKFQAATGCRPNETCIIRPCDIDREDPHVWTYSPSQHKTRHHGRERVIFDHETWGTLGTFPPAATCGPNGESWHSWRVLLLPDLDQTRIYDGISVRRTMNGPNNSQLAKMFPSLDAYQCPKEQA